jgi:hypothetical protein
MESLSDTMLCASGRLLFLISGLSIIQLYLNMASIFSNSIGLYGNEIKAFIWWKVTYSDLAWLLLGN